MKDIKSKLFDLCKTMVQENAKELKASIADFQEAANNETKSTAGDKHDTARSMAQIEVENLNHQLAKVLDSLSTLQKLDIKKTYSTVQLGALVETKTIPMFVSIPLGRVEMDGVNYFCLSTSAPISQLILGKKIGDSYELNGVENTIVNIY